MGAIYFEGRVGEGKVGLDPFHLHVAEDGLHHAFEGVLEVREHRRDGFLVVVYAELLPGKDANAVHLVECKIVACIHRIATIDVP